MTAFGQRRQLLQRLKWGRFQNGRNFQEAGQSRKTALRIADLPGSWPLVGGNPNGGNRSYQPESLPLAALA